MSGCSTTPPPGPGTGKKRGTGGDWRCPGGRRPGRTCPRATSKSPRFHLGPSRATSESPRTIFFFLDPGNPYAANEGWSIAGRDCYENRRLTTHTYMTEFAEARQGPPGKEMALQGPGGPSESRFMQQVGLVFTSYDMHVSSSSYDMHVSSSSNDMHVSSSSYDMHPRVVCSRLDMCSHVCSHVF